MKRLFRAIYSTSNYNFSETSEWAIHNLSLQPIFSFYRDRGVTVKVADAEDFVQLAQSVEKFRDSALLADRSRRDDVCVVWRMEREEKRC